MKLLFLLPICVATITTARPAAADTLGRVVDLASRAVDKADQYRVVEQRILDAVARAVIGRARRAIAIGPHASAFEQLDAKDNATGFGIAFGLGLYTFEVPSGLRLREVIKERIKQELRERIARGEKPDGEEFVRDVVDKVIHDVLDGAYGSQTLQPPKVSVILEGQKTFGDADGFGFRLFLGYGFSKVSIGLSSSVQSNGDRVTGFFGPELALRLTPIGEMRTPVFDLFVRGEVGARSEAPIGVSLGARVLLDVL